MGDIKRIKVLSISPVADRGVLRAFIEKNKITASEK